MDHIKNNGAPGKNTKGAINDLYTDLDTGYRYICTAIFRDSFGGADYIWKRDEDQPDTFEIPEEFEDESDDDEDIPEKTPTAEENSEDDLEIIDLDESEPEEPVVKERPRNNYHKPYNKHYKPNKN